jgi:hypothetical protein
MHIVAHGAEVVRAAAIHDQRLVTAGEEVPGELVPAVEPAGVGPQEPLHARDQVGSRGFQHEVEMVAHETQGVDLPQGAFAGLPEGLQKQLPVGILPEDGFPAVAPVQDVVDRPFVLHAQLPGHGEGCPRPVKLSIVRTDPFPTSAVDPDCHLFDPIFLAFPLSVCPGRWMHQGRAPG